MVKTVRKHIKNTWKTCQKHCENKDENMKKTCRTLQKTRKNNPSHACGLHAAARPNTIQKTLRKHMKTC